MFRRIAQLLGAALVAGSCLAPAASADTASMVALAASHSVVAAGQQTGYTSSRYTANGGIKPLDTYKCTEPGYMKNAGNEKFVTTELGYTGGQWAMLRARAEKVGAWEVFQECISNEFGFVSFWSTAAERWVTAENGYEGAEKGMLRARSTGVGAWERFYNTCIASCSIKNVYANKYVSAELGYSGNNYAMLRARSETVGEWEKFYEYF